tara:strand:+ start:1805 stop:1975 length:171 start_codon:yes stop_codon:yes gene_type:complete
MADAIWCGGSGALGAQVRSFQQNSLEQRTLRVELLDERVTRLGGVSVVDQEIAQRA